MLDKYILQFSHIERTILLDTNLKIILLDHQNNFVETLKIMSNAAKNFDLSSLILIWAFYIIILIQQNYFSWSVASSFKSFSKTVHKFWSWAKRKFHSQ